MTNLNKIFRDYGILLVANKVYLDYCTACKFCQGTEPEKFVEDWLEQFIIGEDFVFDNDVCEVFISTLWSVSRRNG